MALVAIVCGVVAAHFGTRRAWEQSPAANTTPISSHVQANP